MAGWRRIPSFRPAAACGGTGRATTAERRVLSDVAARLNAELTAPSDPRHVDTVVTRVLLGFEQGRGRGDDENEVLIAEYVSALKALPLAAIHAAAERFRSGETLRPMVEALAALPGRVRRRGARGPNPPPDAAAAHPARARRRDLRRGRRRSSARRSRRRPRRTCSACRQAEPARHRAETPAEIARAQRAKLDEDLARLRATATGRTSAG